MNRIAKEILTAIANKCARDYRSAHEEGVKLKHSRQQAMLFGKSKQAGQIYDFIRTRYHELELPYLRDLSGE